MVELGIVAGVMFAESPEGQELIEEGEEEASEEASVLEQDATEIIGNAHASLIHQVATNEAVSNLAESGDYSTIYLNKSLNTAGLNGNLRPDIIAMGKNGAITIIEVVSKSQTEAQMWNKLYSIMANNPGKDIIPEVINPSY